MRLGDLGRLGWMAVGVGVLGMVVLPGVPERGEVGAQGQGGQVVLPLLLRGEEVSLLPWPATVEPATATATASATPEVTPGPSPTPMPQACVGGLGQQLVDWDLDMDGTRARAPERRGMHARQPLYLAVGEGDRGWLAWAAEGGQVHVTPLRGLRRAGDDVQIEGDAPVGLAMREDGGFGVAVIQGEQVALAAYDGDGSHRWDRTLVGDNTHTQAGDKWVDSWGHEGRMVWTGSHYALYMGHTQEFGAQGKHQGDLLWLFDRQGNPVDGRQAEQPSWDWGCSHSLDLRLAYSEEADAVGPVCLSDAYPRKAIMYSHRVTEVWPEPSGDGSGGSDGRLGGLTPNATGFDFSFATKETRQSYDVAMIHIGADGSLGDPLWLTDSAGRDEESPHHAPFGQHWLLGWHEGDQMVLSLFDREGALIAGPANPPTGTDIDRRDDFVPLPSGGVAWPARDDTSGAIQLLELPYCLR